MPQKKTYGGEGYDWSKGRTQSDMKAENKWKSDKNAKEKKEKNKGKKSW